MLPSCSTWFTGSPGRLGPAEAIDRLIGRWRQCIDTRSGDSSSVGTELAKLIWKPLVPLLGGVTSVVISPDGDLDFLPWGALPDETPESYLIERFAFGTIISARQLVDQAASPAPEAAGGELLVVGDIDYEHSAAGTCACSSGCGPRLRRLLPTASRGTGPARPGHHAFGAGRDVPA